MTKYNQTDYTIPCDLTTPQTCVTHIRIENKSLYVLKQSLGLEFAEFRGNKVYIKVFKIVRK